MPAATRAGPGVGPYCIERNAQRLSRFNFFKYLFVLVSGNQVPGEREKLEDIGFEVRLQAAQYAPFGA